MGNVILSRGIGTGEYKVGDIVLSSENSLGDKWALCNGDIITDDTDRDPLSSNCWNTIDSFSYMYTKVLYDYINKIYYGVKVVKLNNSTTTDSSFSLKIYKIDGKETLMSEAYALNTIYDTILVEGTSLELSPYFSDCVLVSNKQKIVFLFYYLFDNTYYNAFGKGNHNRPVAIVEYSIETNSFRIIVKHASYLFSGNEYYSRYTSSNSDGSKSYFFLTANEYMPMANKSSDMVNDGQIYPNSLIGGEIAYGHSAYECGNYLAIMCVGTGNGSAVALFVLDPDSEYTTVSRYDFAYEESIYIISDGWAYNSYDYTSFHRVAGGMSKNYTIIVTDYTNSASSGSSTRSTILSIDNITGNIVESSNSDYIPIASSSASDIAFNNRYIVSCYDWDNDLYAITYAIRQMSGSQKIFYYYGLYNAASATYSHKSIMQDQGVGEDYIDESYVLFFIHIDGKNYALITGRDAMIKELESMDNFNTDFRLGEGWYRLSNLSMAEFDLLANSSNIPYNPPLYIFEGTDSWGGLVNTLPIINEDGVNGFIKIKN